MAKSKSQKELFELLRARGLRKRVAKTLSEAAAKADGGRVPDAVRAALGDLQSVAGEIESRITGKASDRGEAAKKAAQTRKRQAAKRSAAAKKGAKTRRAKAKA